ncbi:hypothetical protein BGZ54_008219 [Gamsiella multidivaricata]|nr:hypothetical protein BGZ54_008219 [Gamsiella multidivaricata]
MPSALANCNPSSDLDDVVTIEAIGYLSMARYLIESPTLINEVFKEVGDSWRLAWVESPLQYIEFDENMSYHIPGFRQTYNWFPKEIYFTAKTQSVFEYRKRDKVNTGDSELIEEWERDEDTQIGDSNSEVDSVDGMDKSATSGDSASDAESGVLVAQEEENQGNLLPTVEDQAVTANVATIQQLMLENEQMKKQLAQQQQEQMAQYK